MESANDASVKRYVNQFGKKMIWNGHTTQMNLESSGAEWFEKSFSTNTSKSLWGGARDFEA